MENNTNNNQTSEKKSSNRFKQAAERQKVAPGGNSVQPSQEQVNPTLSFTAPVVSPVPETTNPEPVEEKLDVASILQSRYAEARYQRISDEGRTKSFQALLKPSISERMKKDTSKKKIKSANDLINFLLEEYYGLHDEQKK